IVVIAKDSRGNEAQAPFRINVTADNADPETPASDAAAPGGQEPAPGAAVPATGAEAPADGGAEPADAPPGEGEQRAAAETDGSAAVAASWGNGLAEAAPRPAFTAQLESAGRGGLILKGRALLDSLQRLTA
ncbi:MAG TPA: hypothetical protein VEH84_12205, partial [Alphaproteobacteria bacterium]|nr:hypothetical protein [Alphaproteobacteria bacterium]